MATSTYHHGNLRGPPPPRIPQQKKQEIAGLVVWLFLGGFRWHWDGALVTFHSTGWVDRDPYAGLLFRIPISLDITR